MLGKQLIFPVKEQEVIIGRRNSIPIKAFPPIDRRKITRKIQLYRRITEYLEA
ncbi:hypothetical protein MY9_0304 [Bacillus sp. JS]|nr:hypothetical protein MY9_0304 [Bacillus sp. JS]